MLALRRLAPATLRSLHTSAPARKAKAVEVDESDDFAEDLFDEAQVEAASGNRGARRAALSDSILNRTSLRVGDLRKVVQLSDSVEDLEQLGTVLQSWRAQGKKVTDQTAVEIVGEWGVGWGGGNACRLACSRSARPVGDLLTPQAGVSALDSRSSRTSTWWTRCSVSFVRAGPADSRRYPDAP
ncbi:hypothetical protein VHUM_03303 [Vanrija humicola]|uniref:Uncharacterized protein n=1 Tax=Vanrija humicola TaxID=5417 RepID=A0A7D8UYY3_VANHU|nr:hypothetical protein VHUM_03303 [Vanrija humicola]